MWKNCVSSSGEKPISLGDHMHGVFTLPSLCVQNQILWRIYEQQCCFETFSTYSFDISVNSQNLFICGSFFFRKAFRFFKKFSRYKVLYG